MRRILVPLDGSPFGEAALSLAGEIAERTGRSLELVTVTPPVGHPDISASLTTEIERGHGASARSYLDRQARELHRRFEVAVFTAVPDGPVPSAIAQHARHDPPELIVMSTHGRTGPSRLLSGSVADRLLRELRCPFILVRPGRTPAAGRLPPLPRVLVTLDGSSLAETVLDEVARFFPGGMANLYLLRVIAPADVLPVGTSIPLVATVPDSMEARLLAAEAYLESAASKLCRLGWEVEREVVVGGHPSVAVLCSAAAHQCDLIAIATRGLGGVKRMILGSVADEVIRGADTPVLVVNPSAGASSLILREQLGALSAV